MFRQELENMGYSKDAIDYLENNYGDYSPENLRDSFTELDEESIEIDYGVKGHRQIMTFFGIYQCAEVVLLGNGNYLVDIS